MPENHDAILGLMHLTRPSISTVMRWVTLSAGILLIPLSLLLFVQWPLRDWLQAYSRQANDGGQILFALYAAVAVTAASLSKNHLAIRKPETGAGQERGSWRNWALLVCVAPWAVFLMWTAVPQMLRSMAQLESFSEALTPGYFILRMALVLLALLVLVEAVHSAFSGVRRRQGIDHS
jgi:TRAP-type C4-dicarboxylate transport system permease small subunit